MAGLYVLQLNQEYYGASHVSGEGLYCNIVTPNAIYIYDA